VHTQASNIGRPMHYAGTTHTGSSLSVSASRRKHIPAIDEPRNVHA